jgi:hypothetical protein
MDFFTWTATWIWWMFEVFIWIAALMILFMIIVDLFRDHTLAGGWKALWLVALLIFPLVGSLVYIIARGKGMSQRWARHRSTPEERDWKPAASSSPADDIARAKELLDVGSISQGEFDALKSKALGKQFFG